MLRLRLPFAFVLVLSLLCACQKGGSPTTVAGSGAPTPTNSSVPPNAVTPAAPVVQGAPVDQGAQSDPAGVPGGAQPGESPQPAPITINAGALDKVWQYDMVLNHDGVTQNYVIQYDMRVPGTVTQHVKITATRSATIEFTYQCTGAYTVDGSSLVVSRAEPLFSEYKVNGQVKTKEDLVEPEVFAYNRMVANIGLQTNWVIERIDDVTLQMKDLRANKSATFRVIDASSLMP